MRRSTAASVTPSVTASPATLPAVGPALLAVVALVAGLLTAVGTGPAAAAPAATNLTLSGPASGRITSRVPLASTLTDGAGNPLAGQKVTLQRARGSQWVTVSTATTGPRGRATIRPVVTSSRDRYRSVYAGTADHAAAASAVHVVTGTKYYTTLRISGARKVVDERQAALVAEWKANNGKPISGAWVRLYSRPKGQAWRLNRTAKLGPNGYTVFRLRPRVDTRYMMRGVPGSWYRSDASPKWTIDNVPPARPWYDPPRAPRPGKLPAQRRGFGSGAYVRVMPIPNGVWNHMKGISWRPGCPVGRSGLRLIRTNYWGFDGYRHRGELIVNAKITHKYVGVLRDLYAAKLPLRAMYRVDRFGYSARSGGGNDFASMRHDNTSAFNCRWVTGNPGTTSPHSTGRAFDLNTWENPYRSRQGWLPNTWWVGRADARVAWRSGQHRVVKILRRNGFSWTYGNGDSQHFDGREIKVGATFTG